MLLNILMTSLMSDDVLRLLFWILLVDAFVLGAAMVSHCITYAEEKSELIKGVTKGLFIMSIVVITIFATKGYIAPLFTLQINLF